MNEKQKEIYTTLFENYQVYKLRENITDSVAMAVLSLNYYYSHFDNKLLDNDFIPALQAFLREVEE